MNYRLSSNLTIVRSAVIFFIMTFLGWACIEDEKENTDQAYFSQNEIGIHFRIFQYIDNTYDIKERAKRLIKHGVNLRRIVFDTRDFHGNLVKGSGAIFFPESGALPSYPLLAFQHGTLTSHVEEPSNFGAFGFTNGSLNSYDMILAATAASMGYVVVVADYLGEGESSGLPLSQNIINSCTNPVIDAIEASRRFCSQQDIDLNDHLFLFGYSLGGFSTLAVQKRLEESGVKIKASAPAAGAYNSYETGRIFISGEYLPVPHGFSKGLLSVHQTYEITSPLSSIFMSPYDTEIIELFSGKYIADAIDEKLPHNVNDLLQSDFIDKYLSRDTTDQMIDAIIQNDIVRGWVPQSRTRLYVSQGDEISPLSLTKNTYKQFLETGGDSLTIDTKIKNWGAHGDAFFPIFLDVMEWFSGMK